MAWTLFFVLSLSLLEPYFSFFYFPFLSFSINKLVRPVICGFNKYKQSSHNQYYIHKKNKNKNSRGRGKDRSKQDKPSWSSPELCLWREPELRGSPVGCCGLDWASSLPALVPQEEVLGNNCHFSRQAVRVPPTRGGEAGALRVPSRRLGRAGRALLIFPKGH